MKAWLKRRREAKRLKQYKNGFNWAMSSFYLDDMSLDDITNYCWQAIDKNSFDEGAIQAADLIHSHLASLCKPVQFSDQTVCQVCKLSWDTNDLYPPKCEHSILNIPKIT